MKRWLYYLLAFLLVVFLGLITFGAVNPGYILVYVGGYSFETTLVALVLAVLAVWYVFKFVAWLGRTLHPRRLKSIRGLSRFFTQRDPVVATAEGVQELLLGNWQQAYQLLVQHADKMQTPGINYLLAALAAFQRNDRNGWTFCLDTAERRMPAQASGVNSLRALLEAKSGNSSDAMKLLHNLQKGKTNQPFVLQQMADIYRSAGDWLSLEQMLPDLERRHVLAGEALQNLQDEVYQQQLQQAGSAGLTALQQCWERLPKALRTHPRITAAYVQQLLDLGQDAEAASLLEALLKRQWSDEIVVLLGKVNAGNPQQHQNLLENLLRQHPDDPALLLSLGRASLRSQQWRKARDYFEKGLNLTMAPQLQRELCRELAQLLEQLGERDKSQQYYQQAARLLGKAG